MARSFWNRWNAFARHAARVQSNIVLSILYFVVFLPLAMVRRPFAPRVGESPGAWLERPPRPRDLPSARRQF